MAIVVRAEARFLNGFERHGTERVAKNNQTLVSDDVFHLLQLGGVAQHVESRDSAEQQDDQQYVRLGLHSAAGYCDEIGNRHQHGDQQADARADDESLLVGFVQGCEGFCFPAPEYFFVGKQSRLQHLIHFHSSVSTGLRWGSPGLIVS